MHLRYDNWAIYTPTILKFNFLNPMLMKRTDWWRVYAFNFDQRINWLDIANKWYLINSNPEIQKSFFFCLWLIQISTDANKEFIYLNW